MVFQTVNRRWILTQRPDCEDTEKCFTYKEEPIPEVQEGEYLVRNSYMAFDPSMRTWIDEGENYREPIAIGDVMNASTLGEVVSSRHPDYKVGDLVMGIHGWEDYTLMHEGLLISQVVPRIEGIPESYFLGVLGPTGLTAYFGMLDKLKPKQGETVLISAAAGAVGSIAGQIAKLKGARVIGLAGSDDKCDWLTHECGFDAAVNYRKTDNLSASIKEVCPDGIDAYFDNVGGSTFDAALENINLHGRVTCCGFISGYNSNDESPSPPVNNMWLFLIKNMTMNSVLLTDYVERAEEAYAELIPWVTSGAIKHREHIVDGFEKAPATMQMLFDGSNTGKLILTP